MSTRYLGAISIERFLAVERYRQSQPPSVQPTWTVGPTGRRAPAAGPRTARPAGRDGRPAVSG
jgi:hypothetical protein